jgi:hypothetical protein
VEEAGAEASRPLRRIFISFSESLPIPADASGAYRPNPRATRKLAGGHPSLKGYMMGSEKVLGPGRSGTVLSPRSLR